MEDILIIFCIKYDQIGCQTELRPYIFQIKRSEGIEGRKNRQGPPDINEEWKDLSGEDLGKALLRRTAR